MFTAIMKVENGRIAKYENFITEQEALDHIARFQHHDPVEYEGDGVKESFAIPFKIKNEQDVKVSLRDISGPISRDMSIEGQNVVVPIVSVEKTETVDGVETTTVEETNVLKSGEFIRIERTLPAFPEAFVTTLPGSYIGSLKVNPDKTLSLDVPVEPIKKGIGSYAEKLISVVAPSDKVDQMLARAARLNAEHGIKGRPLTAEENSEVDQLIAVDNYRIAVRNEAARYIAEDLPKLTEEQKLNFNPATAPNIKWPTL